MSQDDLCRLWCFVDHEDEEPFSAEANLKWDVEQLTKSIKREKNELRELDTSDVVLLKLNEPIPVNPEATLRHRLPRPIADFSVKLGLTRQVSDAFPDRPKHHLQIIVTLRDRRPSKKRRLDSPETPEVPDDLDKLNLWNTFWGKQAPDCFVKDSVRIPDPGTLEMASQKTDYEYLKLPYDDGLFPCGLPRMLIIETYKSLYAKLREQDELYTKLSKSDRISSLTHSTIIMGQPGTGKTVGLSCILVWRLQEKKPTVYCDDGTYAYVFTSTGVRRVSLNDKHRIKELDNDIDCCALVDINPQLLTVPPQFQPSERRQGRVVVATSPNPDHIAVFKQDHGKTYYTPTWKWPDLYCASLVRFSSVDPAKLWKGYTMLRGIPRRCFRALQPQGYEHEMQIISDAINNIQNFKDFAHSATGPLPFHKASHALVRVEPADDTWNHHTTDLLSDYVAELVFDRISFQKSVNVRDLIDDLLRTSNAHGWGGKLFKLGVHRRFRQGIKFKPRPMDKKAPALTVQIKKAESESSNYFHTLSVRAMKNSPNVGVEFLDQYLIPLSSTAEAVDAVYISKRVTVLFQITISPSHNLNLKGIKELIDELPSNAKKRICIVFIVPDHDTTCKPYKRQKIVDPHGLPEDVSDSVEVYNQYVYYFPMPEF